MRSVGSRRKDDAMTTDSKFQAALGLHRFGFGPRRDSSAALASDPHADLLADLDRPLRAGRWRSCSVRSTTPWHAVKTNMGPAWRETVVALTTEFGRTARINGTLGTDHGTGTVVLLAGGALKGGRVIADWPGLKPADLLEDRDLKATIDIRGVLKGILRDHLPTSAHSRRTCSPTVRG